MTQTGTVGAPPADIGAWHAMSIRDALVGQSVTVEQGLTTAEADARRAKAGPNRFTESKHESRVQAFLRQYRDPMQVVLEAAASGPGNRDPSAHGGEGLAR